MGSLTDVAAADRLASADRLGFAVRLVVACLVGSIQ